MAATKVKKAKVQTKKTKQSSGKKFGLIVTAVVLFAIVGSFLIFSSQAAKPASTGTIAIDDPTPTLGENLAVFTSYTGQLRYPRVQLTCYQNGVMVYGEASSTQDASTLGFYLGGASSAWQTNGGDADCTATLYYITYKGGQQYGTTLATTQFKAYGN